MGYTSHAWHNTRNQKTAANNPKITHTHPTYQDTYIPWQKPKTHTEFVRTWWKDTHQKIKDKKEGNGTSTKGSYHEKNQKKYWICKDMVKTDTSKKKDKKEGNGTSTKGSYGRSEYKGRGHM